MSITRSMSTTNTDLITKSTSMTNMGMIIMSGTVMANITTMNMNITRRTTINGRGYREIRGLIEKSDLSEFVKRHAVGIFERIAKAEGKIHGMKPDKVTFHEVGALDSIADIVLACVGIELLKVDRVVVSPLAEGRGWIDAAHGRFPVPAPATLEILTGISLGSIDEPFEFITPTGAAIVAEFAESFGPMPALKIEKIGYGVGSRGHEEPAQRPAGDPGRSGGGGRRRPRLRA